MPTTRRLTSLYLLLTIFFSGCAHNPDSPSHIHHPPGYGPQHYAPNKMTEGNTPDLTSPGHQFTDVDHWRKVFDDPEREAWQKPQQIIDKMKIGVGMTVVDLGAGTGYFLPYLNTAVGTKGKVLALDVEPNLVGYMQERIRQAHLNSCEARLILPTNPKLANASVDRILIVDTWHHIEDRTKYSALLKRALKPGGEIWIVDFEPQAGGPGPKSEHRIAPHAVTMELRLAGLKTEQVNEELPYQYIIRAINK